MSIEQVREDTVETIQGVAVEPVEFSIPVPKYTVALLICIVAVFAAQLWVDGPGSTFNFLFHELVRSSEIAGFVKPAFYYGGEYWRILTGAFLHGFLVHILLNGYALYSFGKLFELLTNRAHLVTVFLISAISGGLLSFYFLPAGTSVGASGGIVGLIGYLLIYAFRRRQFISSEFRKSLLLNIAFILAFGLVLNRIVDNWGHIGGLLAGAIYGLLQISGDPYKDPQDAGAFIKMIGWASLGICIATSLFSIYLILSA